MTKQRKKVTINHQKWYECLPVWHGIEAQCAIISVSSLTKAKTQKRASQELRNIIKIA
jgi:hypothetical protein